MNCNIFYIRRQQINTWSLDFFRKNAVRRGDFLLYIFFSFLYEYIFQQRHVSGHYLFIQNNFIICDEWPNFIEVNGQFYIIFFYRKCHSLYVTNSLILFYFFCKCRSQHLYKYERSKKVQIVTYAQCVIICRWAFKLFMVERIQS